MPATIANSSHACQVQQALVDTDFGHLLGKSVSGAASPSGLSCYMRSATRFVSLQGVPVAPTFYPTPEEFTDPLAYIEKIKPKGERYAFSTSKCLLSYKIDIASPCNCMLTVAAVTFCYLQGKVL